jgi:hypothetical protein
MIKKFLFSTILFINNIEAEDTIFENTLNSNIDTGTSCFILKEENSVICKYTQERTFKEKVIKINWIDPNGNISRTRDIIMPSGHGSIYDFRYIKGRILGKWTFIAIDDKIKYKTTFNLE